MKRTILTLKEAKQYSKLKDSFPDCDLDCISDVESYEFKKCLPSGLEEELRAHLIDYSDVESYDPEKEYKEFDLVIYCGNILEAKKDNPGSPDCKNWQSPDKFSKECYNILWCESGLAKYLSMKLLLYIAMDGVGVFTGNGIVQKRGSDFVPATKDLIAMKLTDWKMKAKRALEMVNDFLKSCDDETCFLFLQNLGCGCVEVCKCKVNTSMFRVW